MFLAGSILILAALMKVTAAVAFLFRLRLPRPEPAGRISLILPLAGDCASLPRLIRALGSQTLRPRNLLIAVESTEDPAFRHGQQAAAEAEFPVRVIVAGLAEQCAQKCWNQIAALQHLDGHDCAVVLCDGDIEPPPEWLSLLVAPILTGRAEVVTGYRWPRISRQSFTQHLVATIDRGIALLPSPNRFKLTWGGSVALSPTALAALDLPTLLGQTLSDDCAIGLRAHQLGLRVLTRRLLRVPSQTAHSLRGAWQFGRRQYQIIHLYRPNLWRLAMTVLSLRLFSWAGLMLGIGQRGSLVVILAILSLLGIVVILQHAISRRLAIGDPGPTVCGQMAMVLLDPLTTLIHWSVVAGAWRTRTIHWGHVRYQIDSFGNIRVTARQPWPAESRSPRL